MYARREFECHRFYPHSKKKAKQTKLTILLRVIRELSSQGKLPKTGADTGNLSLRGAEIQVQKPTAQASTVGAVRTATEASAGGSARTSMRGEGAFLGEFHFGVSPAGALPGSHCEARRKVPSCVW